MTCLDDGINVQLETPIKSNFSSTVVSEASHMQLRKLYQQSAGKFDHDFGTHGVIANPVSISPLQQRSPHTY